MLLVKHMMLTKVITAKPNTTVKEIIKTLYEKHIGCVVILDDNSKVVGIFTERDAIRLVAENVQLNQSVDNLMTKNVITLKEDFSINEVRKILSAHKVRHLPVVNQKGELIGLLSVRGLLDQFFGTNSQNC